MQTQFRIPMHNQGAYLSILDGHIVEPYIIVVASSRVIVQTTPGLNVATITMVTEQEANTVQGDCANPEDLSTPPENFQQFSTAEFDIDWCQYQVSSNSEDTVRYTIQCKNVSL